jgi:hypothetical protein
VDLCTLLAREDSHTTQPNVTIWTQLYQQVAHISAADVAPGLQGPAISAAIKDLQRQTIAGIRAA